MRALVSLFICVLCASCTPFGGFKPPPDAWTDYRGSGMTKDQIYVALMECGWPYPGDLVYEMPQEIKKKIGADFDNATEYPHGFNNFAYLVQRCMVNAGIPSSLKLYCKTDEDPITKKRVVKKSEIPACQPNAVIPVRSVETRINSRFCKEYPNARACQLDPSAPYSLPQAPPSNTQKNPVEPFAPALNRQMQERQFQEQMQQQSNSQMNELLKNTTPKK